MLSNRTDPYDLCKRIHILFVIISVFPNAGKNALHQLVTNVVQHEHFVFAFFDFSAPADRLIIGVVNTFGVNPPRKKVNRFLFR